MQVGSILLVEDNLDDEALILRALRKANVTNPIDIVRDGAEALDYFFGRGPYAGRGVAQPTVTLLDLNLPKVDGLEVLTTIRKDPRTSLISVVVLTSSDEQEDIVRSYNLGANSYVRKPVDFRRFSETVAQLGLYWLLVNEPPPRRP
jgi:two-component system, response regulator